MNEMKIKTQKTHTICHLSQFQYPPPPQWFIDFCEFSIFDDGLWKKRKSLLNCNCPSIECRTDPLIHKTLPPIENRNHSNKNIRAFGKIVVVEMIYDSVCECVNQKQIGTLCVIIKNELRRGTIEIEDETWNLDWLAW